MISVFALPAYARIGMIAEGIPVDEMLNSSDVQAKNDLINLVSTRYPQFMKTNLKKF